MIAFGREIGGNLKYAGKLEWLVTNGIGGYASGTVAGCLTRTYHGLLIAALKPPLGRTLLLAKIDDTASYLGHDYPLFLNHWATGVIEPHGYQFIEQFQLEGTTPVWTYALQDAFLEKRIWMQQGANTTYIHYTYVHPRHSLSAPEINLTIKALVNFRNHHEVTHINHHPNLSTELRDRSIQVTDSDRNDSFYLLSDSAKATLNNSWYADYYLSMEAFRGLEAVDDHMNAGSFQATLQPGETVTLVASTRPNPELKGKQAYLDRKNYERRIWSAALPEMEDKPTALNRQVTTFEQLVLAADQFIVQRESTLEPEGNSVIAGYHWFGDWGRDTMISLPGFDSCHGSPGHCQAYLAHFLGLRGPGHAAQPLPG